MAWSLGHSLILILVVAVLVGLAAAWLRRSRLTASASDTQSVTGSDNPHQTKSLVTVPVEDTPAAASVAFVERPVEASVEEPVNTPVEESSNAPVNTPVEEPVNTTVEEPIDASNEEPVSASVAAPADEPQTASDSTAIESEVDQLIGAERSGTEESVEPVEPIQPIEPVAPIEPKGFDPEPATPAEPVGLAPVSTPATTVDQPTEAIPTKTIPTKAASVEAASVEAPPTEVMPTDTAPTDTAPATVVPAEVVPQPDNAEPAAPVEVGPAAGADDNLRRIDGIGPKIALALNAAGIRTYRQLAEATEPELRAALRAANVRSAPGLSAWAQKAQVLVNDGTAGAAGSPTLTAGDQITPS